MIFPEIVGKRISFLKKLNPVNFSWWFVKNAAKVGKGLMIQILYSALNAVRNLSGKLNQSSDSQLGSGLAGLQVAVACDPENKLLLDGLVEASGEISISGRGNEVKFSSGSKFKGSLEVRGKNNSVVVGANCVVRGRIVIKGSNQTVSIGDYTTFQSVYLLCDENCDVHIGRWCMFSRDVEVRTTDAHSVVDIESRIRVNAPKSVFIGDHVWVGVGALISKGTVVPDDSIIGAHSFVNGTFTESHVIIAGSPAKVVKTGVTWNRGRKEKFSNDELHGWKTDS